VIKTTKWIVVVCLLFFLIAASISFLIFQSNTPESNWEPTIIRCEESRNLYGGNITEISLEKVGSWVGTVSYVKLTKDGSVSYSDRTGKYRGQIDTWYFDGLATLIETQSYFDFKDIYESNLTDAGYTITSVVRNNNRKTVTNYAFYNQIKLWGIEMAIELLWPVQNWKK